MGLVFAIVGALLPTVPGVWAAERRVTLRTEDGVTLVGSYDEPARRPAPGIVLVHMLTRTHEDWQPLISRLAGEGFAVLAIDLRGHSGSGGERSDLTAMLLDVRAAEAFLGGRPEVIASSLGIAGASIGANLAVLAAADDEAVRSVALLSPGLDYRGLRTEAAMKKYGPRPALLVASVNDAYAARSVRTLASIGPGKPETRMTGAAGHGTVLLSRDHELVSVLVDWFRRTLL